MEVVSSSSSTFAYKSATIVSMSVELEDVGAVSLGSMSASSSPSLADGVIPVKTVTEVSLPVTVKIEAGSTATTSPAKTLTINQIAAQLANSKASQSAPANILIAPRPASSQNGNTNKNTDSTKANNPIVAKMTEALSLKQSPTLTKQLAKPSTSSSSGLQVITQYMCRYCGQQFDSTDQMQKHIQEHVEGKTPHECSVCGKTYRTPSKLQRHVRVHSGERPYACSVCGRRFTRSDHVKQHMKVHFQPKDTNTCHLCADMKFNRRQALHAHLLQQHCLQQVFTCHRCGEAFESLEEMQTHKLCHDTILNSMKDGSLGPAPQSGIAKFSLGVQKSDNQSMNRYDFINIKPKTDAAVITKTTPVLQMPTALYVPANLDNVSALSNKLILEGMEKMAKEDAAEMQKKYEAELMQLNVDASKFHFEQTDVGRQADEVEKAKIAQAFNIKAEPVNGNATADKKTDDFNGRETTHIVNGDGMAMFILPTLTQPGKRDVEKMTESEMEIEESEQNSGGLNHDGDARSDADDSEQMDDSGVADCGNLDNKEGKISPGPGYSKPCPRSKKPGFVPIAAKKPETKTVSSDEYHSTAPRSLLSTLNPKINELIKAKVEQNMSTGNIAMPTPQTTFILTNPPLNQQLPKLTLIPNLAAGKLPQTSYQTILPAPSSSSVTLAAVAASVAGQSAPKKARTEVSNKLIKCEHCCMWFEDTAMSMLHNTLHSADSADPFTCRKCYKKLGNRLEFMAHLIWHLEPNMDI